MNETRWLTASALSLILLAGCDRQSSQNSDKTVRRAAPTASAVEPADEVVPPPTGTRDEPSTGTRDEPPTDIDTSKPAEPTEAVGQAIPDKADPPPAARSKPEQAPDEPVSKSASKPAVHKRARPNRYRSLDHLHRERAVRQAQDPERGRRGSRRDRGHHPQPVQGTDSEPQHRT